MTQDRQPIGCGGPPASVPVPASIVIREVSDISLPTLIGVLGVEEMEKLLQQQHQQEDNNSNSNSNSNSDDCEISDLTFFEVDSIESQLESELFENSNDFHPEVFLSALNQSIVACGSKLDPEQQQELDDHDEELEKILKIETDMLTSNNFAELEFMILKETERDAVVESAAQKKPQQFTASISHVAEQIASPSLVDLLLREGLEQIEPKKPQKRKKQVAIPDSKKDTGYDAFRSKNNNSAAKSRNKNRNKKKANKLHHKQLLERNKQLRMTVTKLEIEFAYLMEQNIKNNCLQQQFVLF